RGQQQLESWRRQDGEAAGRVRGPRDGVPHLRPGQLRPGDGQPASGACRWPADPAGIIGAGATTASAYRTARPTPRRFCWCPLRKLQAMDMDDKDELRAWLIALRTPGLGPGGLRERLDAMGGDIRAVLARPDEGQLAADEAWLAEPGHRLLRCTEADFPPQLDNIPQPPAALFVVGD